MPLTLLLGGARSGKSAAALRLAQQGGAPVTYLATAEARDEEMAQRIARHKGERPPAWSTVEEPRELLAAMERAPADQTLIIDCLTLWVSNLIDDLGDEQVLDRSAAAARTAAARPGLVIAVSNEVGAGIVPMSALGRRYRDLLGQVNTIWATHALRAALLVAGRLLWLPPGTDPT
jgi:adenosyl cobinamide kinase/adenosyl cobinamide phosphate guanylyltransferase